MAERWRAPGGWTVEIVHLSVTPNRHDGEWLRVNQYGFWTADVRAPVELEQFFPVSDPKPDTLTLAA